MIKKRYPIILSTIGLLFTVVALSIPFISKYLVDEAISIANNNSNYDKLILFIILISIFTISAVLIKIIEYFLYSRFYVNLEYKLKNQLFESITYKSLSDLSLFKSGDIEVLYEQDIKNVLRMNLSTIPQFIKQISRALIAIILLFILDESQYKLMIIILLGIGILALVGARIYSKIIKPHHKKVLEKDSEASNFFIESFNHHKQIIAYNSFERSIEYYDELNNNSKKEKRIRNNILYTANSLMYAYITIIYSVCIIVGAIFIAKGIYTYGILIAIIQLINNIEAPFINLSGLINNYNLGKTSQSRLLNIINLNNVNNDNEIDDFDYIKIEDLSFSYDNERMIINNLNMDINKGDIIKIDGPSGIGKTTLLLLIMGFLNPNKGNIYFVKDNNKYETFKNRNLISYLSQENILFSATILENIYILTGVKDLNKIEEALKLANIYDELMLMKDKLNTKINNNCGLSLGQIQRILIAILILFDKPILLLDEFSSSLDKDNEKIIIDNLLSLNKTIIYITHRNNDINNKILKIEK